MQFLELDDVIEIHAGQISNYLGSGGVRDLRLLESAVAQAEAGFGGQFLHADVLRNGYCVLISSGNESSLY